MSIQIKRGNTTQIKSSTETLESGQLLLDLDTQELYAGVTGKDVIKDLRPITASNIKNTILTPDVQRWIVRLLSKSNGSKLCCFWRNIIQ